MSTCSTSFHFHYMTRETNVDTQRDIPVTSIRLKLISHQFERDERDVRVVHCLQCDALVGTVEVAISDELLDGFESVLLYFRWSLRLCRQMSGPFRPSWSWGRDREKRTYRQEASLAQQPV
jgi:hypothetical protein